MELVKGQKVDYNFIWAGGSDITKHLKNWFPGYVVVDPVSPFAKGCALIKRENHQGIGFNAAYEDIRPSGD